MTNRQKNLPPATEQAAFSQLPKKAYLCRMDFARILTERYALSDEGTGLLMQSATLTQHARKEVIIEEGQRDPDVCFVARGSVRTYVMREDKCVIVSFSFEGDPATATLGTQPGGLSRQTIETMEPTTLVRIPRARMDALFAGNRAGRLGTAHGRGAVAPPRGLFRRLCLARQTRTVRPHVAQISPADAAHRPERPRGLPLSHAPKPEPHPRRGQMTRKLP